MAEQQQGDDSELSLQGLNLFEEEIKQLEEGLARESQALMQIAEPDTVLVEYISVMLVTNRKSMHDVKQSLRELLGKDVADPLGEWLCEYVRDLQEMHADDDEQQEVQLPQQEEEEEVEERMEGDEESFESPDDAGMRDKEGEEYDDEKSQGMKDPSAATGSPSRNGTVFPPVRLLTMAMAQSVRSTKETPPRRPRLGNADAITTSHVRSAIIPSRKTANIARMSNRKQKDNNYNSNSHSSRVGRLSSWRTVTAVKVERGPSSSSTSAGKRVVTIEKLPTRNHRGRAAASLKNWQEGRGGRAKRRREEEDIILDDSAGPATRDIRIVDPPPPVVFRVTGLAEVDKEANLREQLRSRSSTARISGRGIRHDTTTAPPIDTSCGYATTREATMARGVAEALAIARGGGIGGLTTGFGPMRGRGRHRRLGSGGGSSGSFRAGFHPYYRNKTSPIPSPSSGRGGISGSGSVNKSLHRAGAMRPNGAAPSAPVPAAANTTLASFSSSGAAAPPPFFNKSLVRNAVSGRMTYHKVWVNPDLAAKQQR